MIQCKSRNGFDVWVSCTYDVGPNTGGYFCQIYLDENCNREVGDFTIPADIVESMNDEDYIRKSVADLDIGAIYEWCPHCGEEVVLVGRFMVQVCPSCGRHILPCSMCDECVSKCPLGEKYNALTKPFRDLKKECIEKVCVWAHDNMWKHPHTGLVCAEWDGEFEEFIDKFVEYLEREL